MVLLSCFLHECCMYLYITCMLYNTKYIKYVYMYTMHSHAVLILHGMVALVVMHAILYVCIVV